MAISSVVQSEDSFASLWFSGIKIVDAKIEECWWKCRKTTMPTLRTAYFFKLSEEQNCWGRKNNWSRAPTFINSIDTYIPILRLTLKSLPQCTERSWNVRVVHWNTLMNRELIDASEAHKYNRVVFISMFFAFFLLLRWRLLSSGY